MDLQLSLSVLAAGVLSALQSPVYSVDISAERSYIDARLGQSRHSWCVAGLCVGFGQRIETCLMIAHSN